MTEPEAKTELPPGYPNRLEKILGRSGFVLALPVLLPFVALMRWLIPGYSTDKPQPIGGWRRALFGVAAIFFLVGAVVAFLPYLLVVKLLTAFGLVRKIPHEEDDSLMSGE
jgi:hypothetical protein